MNITICGNFAGAADVFTSTGCSGVCTNLVKTPSNYDKAFCEISYIEVFRQGSGGGGTTGSGTAGADTSTSTSALEAGMYSMMTTLMLTTLEFELSFLTA